MISPATLMLALAPLTTQGVARTWIVDFFEAPDADFATIQEAVDAAADGDTILVRPGAVYDGFEIVGKDLVVTAEEGSRVEDCVFSVFSSGIGFGTTPLPQQAMSLTDCLSVVLLDSVVQGVPAVRSTRSGLHALGSTITCLAGPAPGIELDEAFALVSGGSVHGGPGVIVPSTPCPSDAGPAVLATNVSELATQAALLEGGTIDPILSSICVLLYGIGTAGVPAAAIAMDASSTVDALPGSAHTTTTTPLAREGATLVRTFRGEPGELVYLFVADEPDPVFQAFLNGSTFTPAGTPFVLLGTLDGTGTLVTTLPASLAIALDGTSLAQALFVDGGGSTFAGSPSTTTVVDTGVVLRTGIDCNQNGVSDALDLALGTSLDCDHDGVPDECQPFSPTIAQTLQAFDGKEDDGYGAALAHDGDTLVVGAPYDRTVNFPFIERGAVYVYDRVGSGPWLQTQKLLYGSIQSGHFGAAVALEGDTLVVGIPEHTDSSSSLFSQGRAQVFERDGSGTWGLVQTLEMPVPLDRAYFGSQVAIANGELVVAAPKGDDLSCGSPGQVFVYRRVAGTWSLEQTITTTTASPYCFGRTIALEDGLLAIGTTAARSTGRVELFELSGGTWTPLQVLLPSGPSGPNGSSARFGDGLSLSGSELLAGSRYQSTASLNDGAVLAFERAPGGGWLPAPVDELLLPPGLAHYFGERTAVAADLAVAAAPRQGTRPTLGVFPRRADGRWPRLAPTMVELDHDVTALALVDGLVVVGQAEGDGQQVGSGVVLVYRLDDLMVPNPCRLSGPRPTRHASGPQAR